MILEKIIIGNTEYYQWKSIAYINGEEITAVGDIFSDWREIPAQRVKEELAFNKFIETMKRIKNEKEQKEKNRQIEQEILAQAIGWQGYSESGNYD